MHTDSYNTSLMMPLISAPEFPKHEEKVTFYSINMKLLIFVFMFMLVILTENTTVSRLA